jgi:hypothetical protein
VTVAVRDPQAAEAAPHPPSVAQVETNNPGLEATKPRLIEYLSLSLVVLGGVFTVIWFGSVVLLVMRLFNLV